MQNSIQKQLTTTERLKMTADVYNDQEQWFYNIFRDDIENIKSTIEQVDIGKFHQAVHILEEAQNIYIAANRSAAALGIFLQYYLHIILGKSEIVRSVENLSEQLYNLGKKTSLSGSAFRAIRTAPSKHSLLPGKKDQKRFVLRTACSPRSSNTRTSP